MLPIIQAALADARPLAHNGYKVTMAAGAAAARHRRGGRCGMSIGTRRTRIEGPLKVTGAAKYAADNYPAGLLHAVLVGSPRAPGTADGDRSRRARRRCPGVRGS